jgi:hypothetical protein
MRQGANKRSRGRNGRNKPHIPLRMQTFDSSGPDVRIRGSAWQVHERYLNLARDAMMVGDRVAAENFFQHADHYYRMINLNGEGRPQHGQHPQQQGGQGQPQPPGGPQPHMANGQGNGPQHGQGPNGHDQHGGHDDQGDLPPRNIAD